MTDAAGLVDLERYPLDRLASPRGQALLSEARRSLAARGVAILPGFATPAALAEMTRDVLALLPRAYHEDVSVGTPYLELPDPAFPEGHPRRTSIHSATSVIAYDLIPAQAAARRLYEWEPLRLLISEVLERRPLFRFADPMGALNLTAMHAGDVQGWHFDSTDFVVSLAIQSSRGGGLFECASRIRSDTEPHYDDVAEVLAGEARARVEVLPMTPGTLMIFEGRHSLHRVSQVTGDVPRLVALFAYDTRPDTVSPDLLRQVRYGRTEPLAP